MAFPASPTVGQTYTTGAGTEYIYTSSGFWQLVGSSIMSGATSTVAGTSGIVPTPGIGYQDARLMGDATFDRTDRLTAISLPNFATSGSIGTAATTVDIAGFIIINQTTTGQTLTLPNPTANTKIRKLTIANTGTASFIIGTSTVKISSAFEFAWNGSAWVPAGGAGANYTASATAPSSPAVADLWYNTTLDTLNIRVYDGTNTEWIDISSIGGATALFTGATASVAGTLGTVPAPAIGQEDYKLYGDATWDGTDRQAFVELTNFTSSGSIGTAATTVDIASALFIPQTTASIVLTLPNPTISTKAKRLSVINTGSVSITVSNIVITADSHWAWEWDPTSAAWYSFTPSTQTSATYSTWLSTVVDTNYTSTTTISSTAIQPTTARLNLTAGTVLSSGITGGSNSITILAAGIYNINASVQIYNGSTNVSTLQIIKNNTTIVGADETQGNSSYTITYNPQIDVNISCAVGDILDFRVANSNSTTVQVQGFNITCNQITGFLPNTTMIGATSTTNGYAGFVPAPTAGQQGEVLFGSAAFGFPLSTALQTTTIINQISTTASIAAQLTSVAAGTYLVFYNVDYSLTTANAILVATGVTINSTGFSLPSTCQWSQYIPGDSFTTNPYAGTGFTQVTLSASGTIEVNHIVYSTASGLTLQNIRLMAIRIA